MSTLTEYLRSEAAHIRAESEQRKAATLDWQRATQDLVTQLVTWLSEADPDQLLRLRQTDNTFEDYDLGRYVLKGLSVSLGRNTVRVVPYPLPVVGMIQPPGDATRRRIDGRVDLDSGMERVPLYLVKTGDRDVWMWWTHGGVGAPFDKGSFEATVLGLLR